MLCSITSSANATVVLAVNPREAALGGFLARSTRAGAARAFARQL